MTGADWAGIIVTIAVGMIGVLAPLLMRLGSIQRENRDAHDKIGENINRVDTRLSHSIDELRREIDVRGRKRLRAMMDAEL